MADSLWWWLTNAVIALAGGVVLGTFLFVAAHYYYRMRFLDQIVRIFEEKPLFIVPKGKPLDGAEDFKFSTTDNLTLRGCYLRAVGRRKGVVLFGLEFGSNRWSAVQYCGALIEAGYDVFAFEPRNTGESDKDPNYQPLQWVTDKDLADLRAAVACLKARPDAPARFGLFGISKGGSVGLAVAAEDPAVRCVATDGAYAAYTTMVPYMRRWVQIYSPYKWVQDRAPDFFYGWLAVVAVAKSASRRGVHYLSVERAARRLRAPLLMIHGKADAYIKPEMAETLYRKARSRDKELWLVAGAKHNQALHAAGAEYHRRLVEFFDIHLGSEPGDSSPGLPAGNLAATGAG